MLGYDGGIQLKKMTLGRRSCGIVGSPVSGSLSPLMQEAAFREIGWNTVYEVFEIGEEELASFISRIKDADPIGFNVTIPYKSRIIQYLDELEGDAETIGTVNTVVNKEGHLIGHNTDGEGAMDALSSIGFAPRKGRKALIIGSGDTARTIGYKLGEKGMDLILMNRTKERAMELASFLGNITEVSLFYPGNIEEVDLIVNCTPLGSKGELPIDPRLIGPDMTVFDVVYRPLDTPLLNSASMAGAIKLPGYRMLLGQGARSFEIWTGKSAPVGIMEKVLLDELEGS